ncbi:hypothetical protein LJC49_02010 [Ruminococcaceae bacterium OttesenSCG-928-I18]|nr:hypothetical protein [Ruminococcaceae bacterium OttesenSCG-928-I18]
MIKMKRSGGFAFGLFHVWLKGWLSAARIGGLGSTTGRFFVQRDHLLIAHDLILPLKRGK